MYDQTKELNSVAIVAKGRSFPDYFMAVLKNDDKKSMFDEVWTVNDFGEIITHDLLFVMDDLKNLKENRYILKWLKDHPYFMTSVPREGYPQAIEFPLEAVVNDLQTDYLNNTVAYMIAYAIYRKVKKLYIYGADYYAQSGEIERLERGRACCEYLLRIAYERDIQVEIGANSRLLDANNRILYGYENFRIKFDKQEDGSYKMIREEIVNVRPDQET